MRILVLSKRQTTNKDILDEHFGRMWEFPVGLIKFGNQVKGICLSYQKRREGWGTYKAKEDGQDIQWFSLNAGSIKIFGFIRYAFYVWRIIREYKPEVIFAMSDTMYMVFGVWIAKLHGIKCICDLQDNYEAYDSMHFFGMKQLFQKALKNADAVVCVSDLLKDYIEEHYALDNVCVVSNGVSKDLFYPQDKNACREKLALPKNVQIIGIAGALYEDRGIDIIFEGFQRLSKELPDIHLAVAGARNVEIPSGENIHDLGLLSHKDVALFFNALDVAIICNRDTLQYTYGFPMKAFEIMSCQTPLISSKVGPLKKVLEHHPECFFDSDDVDSFIKVLKKKLIKPVILDVEVSTWSQLVEKLHLSILKLNKLRV